MKVCFFDIDGTLVLTDRAGAGAFQKTFDELFGVDELAQGVSYAGRSDRGIAGSFFEAHGIENSDDNWMSFKTRYAENFREILPTCTGRVLPGVVDLIAAIESLGDVYLGLITGNLVAVAEEKLTHFGLWDRFPFGGFGDVHPDRNDIAKTALGLARERHGGIAEERVMVIGDTLNDIRCARHIGAYAVAVPTGHTPEDQLRGAGPDLLPSTLEQSGPILDWLAS